MTFIDLSDAEGMFGLFVEFVADERATCQDDPERLRLVEELLSQLKVLEADLDDIPGPAVLQRLRELRASADPGLAGDRVLDHLDDLLDELENLGRT